MNNHTEETFAVAAVLLILFTALFDPRISISLAVLASLAFCVWGYSHAKKKKDHV